MSPWDASLQIYSYVINYSNNRSSRCITPIISGKLTKLHRENIAWKSNVCKANCLPMIDSIDPRSSESTSNITKIHDKSQDIPSSKKIAILFWNLQKTNSFRYLYINKVMRTYTQRSSRCSQSSETSVSCLELSYLTNWSYFFIFCFGRDVDIRRDSSARLPSPMARYTPLLHPIVRHTLHWVSSHYYHYH